MFGKVLTTIAIASTLVLANSNVADPTASGSVIDAFLSDSNPHYTTVHDKISNDSSFKFDINAPIPTAHETCQKIKDVVTQGNFEALGNLTHKWVISAYNNAALPHSGIYLGQHGLLSLGHRLKQTVDVDLPKRNVIIAGYDNSRDTCVLRMKNTGKFKKSGKEFKDIVHYMAIRFYLGKALLVGVFDGHTSHDMVKLYREGTAEGYAHNFARTVFRHGFHDERTLKLLSEDVKFGFSAVGHRGVRFTGKKEFAKFGKLMKHVRSGFKTLPLSLPLLAPKNKFCRTVSSGDNNMVDMCIMANVMSRTGVLHKGIHVQRIIVTEPKSDKVKGVFIHVMSNLRLRDLIDDDEHMAIFNEGAKPEDVEDELYDEDVENLIFGEIADVDGSTHEYEDEPLLAAEIHAGRF